MSFLRWLWFATFVLTLGLGSGACSDSTTAVPDDEGEEEPGADASKPDASKPDASKPDAATEVKPVSLALTPPALSLAVGTSAAVQAVLTLSDRSTRDVTSSVTWSSTDAAVATATAGQVSGLAAGTVQLEASVGDLKKTLPVTVTGVTLVSIEVTPTAPTLPKGLTRPLVATGTFSDQTTQDLSAQVTWSSADAAIASVDTAGVVTGAGVGVADVSAAFGGVTGTTSVTITVAQLVSIALTPPNPTVPRGVERQLVATGTFTDQTTQDLSAQVTWSSAADTTATVSATGLVTAVDPGDVVITAMRDGIAGTTTVTVSEAQLVSIEVSPAAPSVARGRTTQLTATGVYSDLTTQDLTTQVTWASATEANAAISNAAGSQGLATALEIGTTEVTAASGAIVSPAVTLTVSPAALVSIAVTPATASIASGLTQQFVAVGTYSDATTQPLTDAVTWSSSEAAATISNAAGSHGLATGVAAGETIITATLDEVSGTSSLEVSAANLLSLVVTPAAPSIAKGRTQQFVATGTFTDASSQDLTGTVTWSSSTAAASVSNAAGTAGLATSVDVGSTTIVATLGAISGSTELTVTPAVLVSVAVTPLDPTVAIGTYQQLAATGTYSDGTTADLTATATWASSAAATATVSNAPATRGLVTSLAAGATSITATSDAITGTAELTVSTCHVTINEVSVAGATAGDELVELYNGCAFPIDLRGWKLVYQSAQGSGGDSSLVAFNASTVLAPVSFRLYTSAGYVGAGPSDGALSGGGMSGSGGGIGLRDLTNAVRDSLGYGTATNGYIEGTVAAVPAANRSVSRFPADGTDTNNNLADFHVVARTPRAPNL